ncbi:hypothetical protein BU24DRAFT_345926 [Aaosphaeria arxii CBS 175.79]|uniref:Prolyl 4-hydroxylase alpha subunit Fe(2+) 2OG dioxygenase domain-containing protein n=1 Tax=Aaosphaeria arxii CBS 175.79 TaxID=1450172 RepID=A0A6A5XYQ1_9PLEO|nr:uncharacterized protein BU24DRAFT_345926 [Aaosphaeria arxii CBS 175.79]KAF2018302.1 hypothetical protein BU24DRAFT_345926 [Aaosphaeria arxii CBS 175.79]
MLSTRLSFRRVVCQPRLLAYSSCNQRRFSRYSNPVSNIQPALVNDQHDSISPIAPIPKIQVTSNWHTLQDQPLTKDAIWNLFNNVIPSIRHTGFLSSDECQKVAEVIQSHRVKAYFEGIEEANSLQDRIKAETNIDIVGRVAAALQEIMGLETRIALEGDKKYFCGLLRVVDNYIQIHPDFGQYDGPDWEIGRIAGQLTWNILLKKIPGGDTIIYDRQWQGVEDDRNFQKEFPRYAYKPTGVQGHLFKALSAIEGDLTFFNPRNFHEVKPCDRAWDRPEELVRYTLSSFVGLLPGENGKPPTLILWS